MYTRTQRGEKSEGNHVARKRWDDFSVVNLHVHIIGLSDSFYQISYAGSGRGSVRILCVPYYMRIPISCKAPPDIFYFLFHSLRSNGNAIFKLILLFFEIEFLCLLTSFFCFTCLCVCFSGFLSLSVCL